MANSVELFDVQMARVGRLSPVYVYKAVFDGSDSGILTIHSTQQNGNRIFLVALAVSDADTTILTLCSGSTEVLPMQLTAYQGILEKISSGYIFAPRKDEAFGIKCTSTGTFLAHVVEGPEFNV